MASGPVGGMKQLRKAEVEAELSARCAAVAEKARANGTARAPAPVEVRFDPSIIGTGKPSEPEGKVIQRPHVAPAPAPPRRMAPPVVQEPETPSQIDPGADDPEGSDGDDGGEMPDPGTERKRTFKPKVCAAADCENEFTPTGARQIFCTTRCGEREHSRRRSPDWQQPRTCKWEDCDNEFTPQHAVQTYCSDECRQEATRKIKRDEKRRKREERRVEGSELGNTETVDHDNARERYIDFLFTLAEKEPSPDLLDRIERVVGVSSS